MNVADMEDRVNALWERREGLSATDEEVQFINSVLEALDFGEVRVAETKGGEWITHQWLKKAVLLSFRLWPNVEMDGCGGIGPWWDKVPNKFDRWSRRDFERFAFRAVPGAVVRRGAFIGPWRSFRSCRSSR